MSRLYNMNLVREASKCNQKVSVGCFRRGDPVGRPLQPTFSIGLYLELHQKRREVHQRDSHHHTA